MEKNIEIIEKEIQEINKYENLVDHEDVLTFSEYCSANLTIFCC